MTEQPLSRWPSHQAMVDALDPAMAVRAALAENADLRALLDLKRERDNLLAACAEAAILAVQGVRSSMRAIATDIAKQHQLSLDDLRGPRRYKSIAEARRSAMASIYATGQFSYPQIGQFFNRDHTTVLYAVRRHNGETPAEANRHRAPWHPTSGLTA